MIKFTTMKNLIVLILLALTISSCEFRRPDITKAKEILNWSPKVSRAEGFKITYDYFHNTLNK